MGLFKGFPTIPHIPQHEKYSVLRHWAVERGTWIKEMPLIQMSTHVYSPIFHNQNVEGHLVYVGVQFIVPLTLHFFDLSRIVLILVLHVRNHRQRGTSTSCHGTCCDDARSRCPTCTWKHEQMKNRRNGKHGTSLRADLRAHCRADPRSYMPLLILATRLRAHHGETAVKLGRHALLYVVRSFLMGGWQKANWVMEVWPWQCLSIFRGGSGLFLGQVFDVQAWHTITHLGTVVLPRVLLALPRQPCQACSHSPKALNRANLQLYIEKKKYLVPWCN